MKAFLCSVGQKTTQICKEQLEKIGFEVILLDEKESWPDKYRRFIEMADDECFRIDADIILNENLKYFIDWTVIEPDYLMAQTLAYDFYKNNFNITGITFYRKEAIDIIKKNLDNIDWRRPEATAWRLPEINDKTFTFDLICGIHGFFQTKDDLEIHKQHKIDRKQMGDYDFELAEKLINLNNNQ